MPTSTAISLRQRIDEPAIRARFNEVLGKKAAGFVSSVISAVKTNSALNACNPDSVISAAMIAATLDLPINQSLGFAYIVPYKGQAQFQMGWKGYNQLGLRSGQFERMNASAVYEGELQKWDRVTGDFEYDLSKKTSDKIVGYVSYFRLINGYEHYLYMTLDDILAHARKYSQSFDNPKSTWTTQREAMCLKTVHKLNLSKWAPMTQDMELALNFDQATVKNPVTVLEKGEDVIAEYPDGRETESEKSAEPAEQEGAGLSTDQMSQGDPATHQGYESPKPAEESKPQFDPAAFAEEKKRLQADINDYLENGQITKKVAASIEALWAEAVNPNQLENVRRVLKSSLTKTGAKAAF